MAKRIQAQSGRRKVTPQVCSRRICKVAKESVICVARHTAWFKRHQITNYAIGICHQIVTLAAVSPAAGAIGHINEALSCGKQRTLYLPGGGLPSGA
jgi:hypothetical protein